MTGNHPEYTSTAMWDAFEAILDRGGRLMYLGGNGFFWRVAWHPTLPASSSCAAPRTARGPGSPQPGEYYMAFNGEYGGCGAACDRRPTSWSASASPRPASTSQPFRRRPRAATRAPPSSSRASSGEIIGDFGLAGGGAAGHEIDRYDRLLGSPPHALVVAAREASPRR